MSLYELGKMSYDRKQYTKAIEYFARVKKEFDKVQADTKDPLGYADYLEEYASALEQTDNAMEVEEHRSRAAELRKIFEGKDSHTEKTPYGTQCKSL